MPDIIRCDNVSFQYDEDGPFVIDGVSLPVQRGEFVAVLGANGCGKSTLAKLFNAILLPQKGTVWVEGIPTSDDGKVYDIRQKVGMVFQNPDNQIVATVVEEDVAFALENLGVPPDEMRTRIDAAMEAAGVYQYRLRQPHKLSGGQKQRVAIAGILAMDPDCLVLDEATAMLDPHGRERIMRTVRQLNAERGITVVHITHYMEEAAAAGRVIVMDAGRIAMTGTPKEIFSQVEALRALHLDIPQSAELCETLTAAGFAMPRGVLTADECAGLLEEKLGTASAGGPPAAAAAQPAPAETPAAHSSDAHRAPDVLRDAQNHLSAQSAPPIIRVEHLTYTYNTGLPDATTALNDVSFEVPEHSFLGLIGPTGCGKSTLITHFNGLMKPTSGKIYIAGEDLWQNPSDIRRFRFLCGLVFQYPEYQLFEETVARDIAYGPKNMGLSEAEVAERVRMAARFCGIGEDILPRSPFELSGGQKRRVAIAGVIAMQPRLLVLDEPASGLDPEGRDTILNQIKDYHRQTGTSVVLVSHSMEDVAKYADRVLVMREGGIAMYDDMPTVFARAAELLELGLSVPQITKIFLKLKADGLDIPTDVYTVKYAAEMVLRYAAEKGVPPMLRDITIGQHLPGDSPVHRLDPRLKILLTIAYIVILFVFQNPLALAICIVFLVVLYLLARIPARMVWRSLKPLIPILILTTVINLFFTKTGTVLVSFWIFTITTGGIAYAVQMAVRIACLLVGTALLTYTTSPIVLTDAIERLLSPLARFRFPAHELAMMMTIALRFIPTLIEETDKIMSAQKARGALLDTGGLIQRVKALVPVLIPLFLSAFRRADDLAMAMECRCYRGGEGRTRLRQLRITGGDVLATGVCVLVFVAVGFSGQLWALTGVTF